MTLAADRLEDCVARHRRILLSIARNFSSPADRDDLLQEMLLALWHALPRFEGRAAESTFVYRVALNTALGVQRACRRVDVPLGDEDAPDDGPEPPELVELAQRDAAFDVAIAALPRIDRSIVLMHLDELSYREIGDVLGLAESAVGARLTRARQRLARSLTRSDA